VPSYGGLAGTAAILDDYVWTAEKAVCVADQCMLAADGIPPVERGVRSCKSISETGTRTSRSSTRRCPACAGRCQPLAEIVRDLKQRRQA